MYTQVKNLVGMDKSSSDLISMMQNPNQGDISTMKMRTVSVVGVGGLGKTTLAKAVYDKIKGDFNRTAFVPVGRNPDLKKIFKDILIDLDKQRYLQHSTAALDERQLIDELREFFVENKRYLIVIDDIWEVESWETIKLAIDDDNDSGCRIIITTRKLEVATKADKVYKLQPLPYDISRELFIRRISVQEGKYVHNQPTEILDKFIRKCSGIPLAIITMASLLAGKQKEEWPMLYETFDFGSKDNREAENTMRIVSFSYYDLPSHLRTCLLYLNAFPEDSVIDKGSLVWKWVAEGFVHMKYGMRLFEIGEGYFNDLINRSMIQAVESHDDDGIITGCRVHDIVLDFIRSMSLEEIFFTVLDNHQKTLLQQSNVRRLASYNKTIRHGHNHRANQIQVPKLRSFIALKSVTETWALLSSFTLLRVLAIENYIVHLLHLRFLSLRGTHIDRIPEDMGALRYLQTLDMQNSYISNKIQDWPSSSSLLKRLLYLRVNLSSVKEFSVGGMTSLEELVIGDRMKNPRRQLVKDLGCLRELRVIIANIVCDEETRRHLVESLRQLGKLQSLKIEADKISRALITWQATDLVLQHHLRHLAIENIGFIKLPSCIDPSCLPNLSHLDLWLKDADEHDLKTLGSLPELQYLSLYFGLLSPATIHNINDSDACYFPKLRCFKLWNSMISFITNKDDKRVSFHIWNGLDTSRPSVSDDGVERAGPSVSDDELKSALNDDETQSPMPSVSDDHELHRPVQSSKLKQGLAAVVYYLLAFFLHVLAYVKRWPIKLTGLHPLPCNRASSPRNVGGNGNGNGNGEDPAATPCVSDDDENKVSTICSIGAAAAAAPRFMPCLQVLHFEIGYLHDIPNWVYNLGWEHLSWLWKINADLYLPSDGFKNILAKELRLAAEVHPNHLTLHMTTGGGIYTHFKIKQARERNRLNSNSSCGDRIHHQ